MTTIKALCPDCGEVDLAPSSVKIHKPANGNGKSDYSFVCYGCQKLVRKPADARIVNLLLYGGVEVLFDPPAERFPGQPALTLDDAIDFHTLLKSDHWYAHLLRVMERFGQASS